MTDYKEKIQRLQQLVNEQEDRIMALEDKLESFKEGTKALGIHPSLIEKGNSTITLLGVGTGITDTTFGTSTGSIVSTYADADRPTIIIDNKQFELSQKLKQKISELSLSFRQKSQLENILSSYDDLSNIKIKSPSSKSQRKDKNLNIILNRTMGCTNPFARNFDIYAETDDGSCEYLWNIFPQSSPSTLEA